MSNRQMNGFLAGFAIALLSGAATAQTPDLQAKVRSFVDERVAAVMKLPATPESLKENLRQFQPPDLPRGAEAYYQEARERFYAGIAPQLAKIGAEAERRLDAGMSGKTVRTAETEKAHELCQTTWTNDRTFNNSFLSKCVKYPEELAAASCKSALGRLNSKTLGHSRIIAARDERGKLQHIDFDQLVCSSAIDGFEVTVVKPWLFGSSSLELRSTIKPGHTISISMSTGSDRGQPVWIASDITNARPPFDTPLQTLGCLQYDKRSAAPDLAVKAALTWWSETLVQNPYAQGFFEGTMCIAWKNAWNLGQAQPEGLGAASLIKQIIGN